MPSSQLQCLMGRETVGRRPPALPLPSLYKLVICAQQIAQIVAVVLMGEEQGCLAPWWLRGLLAGINPEKAEIPSDPSRRHRHGQWLLQPQQGRGRTWERGGSAPTLSAFVHPGWARLGSLPTPTPVCCPGDICIISVSPGEGGEEVKP